MKAYLLVITPPETEQYQIVLVHAESFENAVERVKAQHPHLEEAKFVNATLEAE